MKTLPIRCRPGDRRPIRAIAFEASSSDDLNSESDQLRRDVCPTHRFFVDASKASPKDWVDLQNTLDETAKNGPPKNTQKFDSLIDGLFEFKSWQLRLVCFFDDEMIICTHGFFKKRQNTPKAERNHAAKLRSRYLEAKKRGQIHHVQPK
jgi:phage-related protein